jgi:hypothetical protein
MATLDNLQRWVAFVPDIGNNRQLPPEAQLVLEVATSLPKETLLRFQEDLSAAPREGESPDDVRIRALSQYMRLVGGPHSLGGRSVANIGDYVRLCIELTGHYNLREVFAAVGYFNSFTANDALFSERLSGGTAFTLHRSAAPEEN